MNPVINPPTFAWLSLFDIVTFLMIAVTLWLALLIPKRLHVLGPFLTFVALFPALLGYAGGLLMQIRLFDMAYTAGGMMSPGELSHGITEANAHVLVGAVCTIALGIETILVLLYRRPSGGA